MATSSPSPNSTTLTDVTRRTGDTRTTICLTARPSGFLSMPLSQVIRYGLVTGQTENCATWLSPSRIGWNVFRPCPTSRKSLRKPALRYRHSFDHYVKPARRRRGGAPPRYDWDAFWAEVVRYAIRNGLHPDGRRGLQQHLEDWTAERWDPPPEASTLRRRMMRLYGKLGRTPGAAPEEVSADPVHAADWDAFWIEVTRYVAVNGLGRRQDLRRHLLQWMEQRWRAPLKQAGVSSRIACLYTASTCRDARRRQNFTAIG